MERSRSEGVQIEGIFQLSGGSAAPGYSREPVSVLLAQLFDAWFQPPDVHYEESQYHPCRRQWQHHQVLPPPSQLSSCFRMFGFVLRAVDSVHRGRQPLRHRSCSFDAVPRPPAPFPSRLPDHSLASFAESLQLPQPPHSSLDHDVWLATLQPFRIELTPLCHWTQKETTTTTGPGESSGDAPGGQDKKTRRNRRGGRWRSTLPCRNEDQEGFEKGVKRTDGLADTPIDADATSGWSKRLQAARPILQPKAGHIRR
eukprot:scaffold435_cov342-Pavlova_lutheri.AAC.47